MFKTRQHFIEKFGDLKRSFWFYLPIIIIFSFLVRFIYIRNDRWNPPIGGDYTYYYYYAIDISHLHWPVSPFFGNQSAAHPPLWPIFLALGDLLGLTTPNQQLIENAVMGCVTVFLIMLTVKRIAGEKAAVFAGFLASAYPGLWVIDGEALSEPAEVLVVALTIYLLVLFYEQPSKKKAFLLGGLVGLCALARSEQILLIFLAIYMIYKTLGNFRACLKTIGVMFLGCFIVLGPWVIRNMVVFAQPEFLSTQLGVTLATDNCNITYYGKELGYWTTQCVANDPGPPLDESLSDSYYRSIAFKYIESHLSRLPIVLLARFARLWNIAFVSQEASQNTLNGWNYAGSWWLIRVDYFFTPFAILGFVLLKRRKFPISIFIAEPVIATIAVLISYGEQRYRAGSELIYVMAGSLGFLFVVYLLKTLSIKLAQKLTVLVAPSLTAERT